MTCLACNGIGFQSGAHTEGLVPCPVCNDGEARTVLIHLNVTVPEGDSRTADEIADAVLGALEVGSDDDSVGSLVVVAPLAEEVAS